jgi:hypothetical protein
MLAMNLAPLRGYFRGPQPPFGDRPVTLLIMPLVHSRPVGAPGGLRGRKAKLVP